MQLEDPAVAPGVQPRMATAARSGAHGELGRRAEPGAALGHRRGRARSAAETRARSLPPGEPPAPLSPPAPQPSAQQPGPVHSPSRRRGRGGGVGEAPAGHPAPAVPLPPCHRPLSVSLRRPPGLCGSDAPGRGGSGCVSVAALPSLRTPGGAPRGLPGSPGPVPLPRWRCPDHGRRGAVAAGAGPRGGSGGVAAMAALRRLVPAVGRAAARYRHRAALRPRDAPVGCRRVFGRCPWVPRPSCLLSPQSAVPGSPTHSGG